MKQSDLIFDTLLQTACAQQRKEDLAAFEALAPDAQADAVKTVTAAPRRRKRTAFGFAAVAAAFALLTLGVAAAWPQLQWNLKNGILYETVENAPAHVEPQQMEFGYLPEGASIEWLDDKPEGEHTIARIIYPEKAITLKGGETTIQRSYLVMQSALREDLGYHIGPNGNPLSTKDEAELKGSYYMLDSIQDLTPANVSGRCIVRWMTDRFMYQFNYYEGEGDERPSINASPNELVDVRRAELVKILQGITP